MYAAHKSQTDVTAAPTLTQYKQTPRCCIVKRNMIVGYGNARFNQKVQLPDLRYFPVVSCDQTPRHTPALTKGLKNLESFIECRHNTANSAVFLDWIHPLQLTVHRPRRERLHIDLSCRGQPAPDRTWLKEICSGRGIVPQQLFNHCQMKWSGNRQGRVIGFKERGGIALALYHSHCSHNSEHNHSTKKKKENLRQMLSCLHELRKDFFTSCGLTCPPLPAVQMLWQLGQSDSTLPCLFFSSVYLHDIIYLSQKSHEPAH